jgi:hypothetical protein
MGTELPTYTAMLDKLMMKTLMPKVLPALKNLEAIALDEASKIELQEDEAKVAVVLLPSGERVDAVVTTIKKDGKTLGRLIQRIPVEEAIKILLQNIS